MDMLLLLHDAFSASLALLLDAIHAVWFIRKHPNKKQLIVIFVKWEDKKRFLIWDLVLISRCFLWTILRKILPHRTGVYLKCFLGARLIFPQLRMSAWPQWMAEPELLSSDGPESPDEEEGLYLQRPKADTELMMTTAKDFFRCVDRWLSFKLCARCEPVGLYNIFTYLTTKP